MPLLTDRYLSVRGMGGIGHCGGHVFLALVSCAFIAVVVVIVPGRISRQAHIPDEIE